MTMCQSFKAVTITSTHQLQYLVSSTQYRLSINSYQEIYSQTLHYTNRSLAIASSTNRHKWPVEPCVLVAHLTDSLSTMTLNRRPMRPLQSSSSQPHHSDSQVQLTSAHLLFYVTWQIWLSVSQVSAIGRVMTSTNCINNWNSVHYFWRPCLRAVITDVKMRHPSSRPVSVLDNLSSLYSSACTCSVQHVPAIAPWWSE